MSKSVREPCFLSAFFVVFIILENYTCSACGSSCVVCSTRCRARSHEGEKNPSAGHHFYWQLVNKLKKRDAGAIPPPHPHFFPFSLSLPSSVCRQLVLSPKKIFLEVMDFSGAGTGGRDIYHSDFCLCFTPSIHFRPCSPVWVFLNTLKCTGMESWSSMINHGRLCQGLIQCSDVGYSAEMHFSSWRNKEKLSLFKALYAKRMSDTWEETPLCRILFWLNSECMQSNTGNECYHFPNSFHS